MLKHYLDLLRHFRLVILAGALGTGVLACLFSIVLLNTMPLYKSTVTLNMQPSEEALMFNSAFMGVTQFSPATIITQTHIERLLSRRVAERALDILIEESGGNLPSDPPTAFDKLKSAIWQTWTILNYGYFQPPTERDQWLNDLMSATDVEMVEGSYILLLEITYDIPEMAARAANALARAYMETASHEFAEDAAAVDAALSRLLTATEAQLESNSAARRQLERQLGYKSVEDGRVILMASRAEADKALADARRQVARLRDRLVRPGSADAGAAATISADLATAEALVIRSAEALKKTETALQALEQTETRLGEIALRIREAETDLAELQDRKLKTQLAREARMNQVGVISAAQVPVYPAFPKVLVNTVVGTVLGAILALAPIALLDVLDDRVRTGEGLRQIVGPRALPSVSRALVAQAQAFLRNGDTPGRALSDFAEVMARRLVTEGRKRPQGGKIAVTALGSAEQIAGLHAVVEAAVRLVDPFAADGGALTKVVALPEIARIGDWAPWRGCTIIAGVSCGEADRIEVERVAGIAVDPEAPPFLAVLL